MSECTFNMLENGPCQAAGLTWRNAPTDCFSSSLKMKVGLYRLRDALVCGGLIVSGCQQPTPIHWMARRHLVAEDWSRFDCEQEEESKDLSLALMFQSFLFSVLLFQNYHNNGWMGIVASSLSRVVLTFPFLHPSVTCGKRELPACCRKQKGGCFLCKGGRTKAHSRCLL